MSTATCFCGGLRAECAGDPIRVSMCHCLNCQHRTGSVCSVTSRWPAERVTITGASSTYERTSDDGNAVRFSFCPACGSTVYYANPAEPGVLLVPVGGFADPTFPAPTVSVYEGRRHAWVTPPAGAERFD